MQPWPATRRRRAASVQTLAPGCTTGALGGGGGAGRHHRGSRVGAPTATPPVAARLQAFDLGGNPKLFFTGQPAQMQYSLQLTATPNQAGWQILDVAVEYGGLIYVLSHNQGAYRLDIYSPSQPGTGPICTTTSFNAAKIAVDFWRNIYALNYEVIPTASGQPPGFTEPSVSLWAPSSSCTGHGCTP